METGQNFTITQVVTVIEELADTRADLSATKTTLAETQTDLATAKAELKATALRVGALEGLT